MDNQQPRIVFEEDFVKDADALSACIRDNTTWDERMRARRTASFGVPYNYSGMIYSQVSMPAELNAVMSGIELRHGFMPNNCLANYYETGDSTMGFHSDSIDELVSGTGVAIVSLGAQRILRFRRIKDKTITFDYQLPSGSLLYMPPEVQLVWRHAVAAHPNAESRISLTFRKLRVES
jgi:alkylated DNA repair dioxygenase AlkB